MLGWLLGCGETDGAEVGVLLGWPDGILEGSSEGCSEGKCVGALDGGGEKEVSTGAYADAIAVLCVACTVNGSVIFLKRTLSGLKLSS